MKTYWNGRIVDESQVSTEKDYRWGSSGWLLLLIFMWYGWSRPFNQASSFREFLFEFFGLICVFGIASNSFFFKKEKPLRSKIAQEKMRNRIDLDQPALSAETRIPYDLDIRK